MGGARGLATHPQKLQLRGIRGILERALKVQGVRIKLPEGKRRYEFKEFHGFRKFFETQATEARMNSKNINKLLNHHVGYESHYYKPLQDTVLLDYLKAVPYLTINDFKKSVLQAQVAELTEARDTAQRMQQEEIAKLRAGYERLEQIMTTVFKISENGEEKFRFTLGDPSKCDKELKYVKE